MQDWTVFAPRSSPPSTFQRFCRWRKKAALNPAQKLGPTKKIPWDLKLKRLSPELRKKYNVHKTKTP
jgi:hypothetical protein